MLKLAAFVALFAGFCWFGMTVPLGQRTLFGHLHAISETKESQELIEATKESAKPLVDDVRRRIAGLPESKDDATKSMANAPTARADAGAGAAPQDEVTASDRHRLRKLLSAADRAAARP